MGQKIIYILTCAMLLSSASWAQEFNKEYVDSLIKVTAKDQVARTSKFLLSGSTFTTAKFGKNDASFIGVGLSPIFLWQPNRDVLLEAEVEISFKGSETNIELGYADASFFLNDYLTIRTGKFISPFGIFQDRLHPTWINKLPTVPVGTGEDDLGVGPTAEIGIDFLGGASLGLSKINYSIFVANGAQLFTDPSDPAKQGTLTYGHVDAISKKMTVGGRLGFLPFSTSSLEVGVSYRNGNVGNKNSAYQKVGAQLYALDLTYVKQLSFIKGMLDIKAQYNQMKVDRTDYIDSADPTGNTTYTFDNNRNSFFAQAAYRPNMSQSKILKKTELVFRYSGFDPPTGAKGLEQIRQYSYGLDYWFTWRTAFKVAYQFQKDNNALFLQVAVGF